MNYMILILLLANLFLLIILIGRKPEQRLHRTLMELDAGRSEGMRKEIVDRLSENQRQQIEALYQMQIKLISDNTAHQEKLSLLLQQSLDQLMRSNEVKLAHIERSINEKLDRSLNERLDASFKTIGEQLSELYRSLGELAHLTSGVQDLNKTLSNVKTRGIWGEVQLERILETMMVSGQYDKNVAVKKNSAERVEFAVKIPDKDSTDQFIYLPIDSKMPLDIYDRIAAGAEAGDPVTLKAAVKELEYRIKAESRTIRDKYIVPPVTTDFAVLFLPTENLFAEVLRIPGLAEWCQKECKVMIAGPTTIAALLNSLQVGFRYLTVNKNSQSVLKLLAAIKAQYAKLNDLIERTQKKLSEAQKTTDDLKYRNDQIHKRLLKIDEIDVRQSNELLGLDADFE